MSEVVSIIIPTYRRAAKLHDAIASVRQQQFQDWKIIVVDDNHDDDYRQETELVMLQYSDDPKIAYVKHEKNMGACKARNTGIEYSTAEFVAFLDDDDLWREDKLDKQVSAIQDTQADFCYCDMQLSFRNWLKVFHCIENKNLYQGLLNQGYGICTSALLIKRDAILSIQGFDNGLPSMQDYDLLLRLAKSYKGVHVQEPLLTYQLAEDGISCNPNSKVRGHQAILNKYKDEYITLELFKGLSRQYESLGDFKLRSGNRISALGDYMRAIKLHVLNPRVWIKMLVGSLCGKGPLEAYLMRRQRNTSKAMS